VEWHIEISDIQIWMERGNEGWIINHGWMESSVGKEVMWWTDCVTEKELLC